MKIFGNEKLKQFCQTEGFDLFGLIKPKQADSYDYFERWLNLGYQANMHWLYNKPDSRKSPAKVLPGCRSIIVLGVSYFNRNYENNEIYDRNQALIARYAWGDDYHRVLAGKLKKICQWLAAEYGEIYKHKYYVDTGPILERDLARQAGFGFVGRNTQLINHRLGSYFFIANIFSQIPFEVYANKAIGSCGSCRKCLDSCPTGALVKDKVLDANKCISYHTIENRGEIPKDVEKKIGNRIFGCDICQEVCPWNAKARKTRMEEFKTKNNRDKLRISELRKISQEEYNQIFTKSAVKRAKYSGLMRNLNRR